MANFLSAAFKIEKQLAKYKASLQPLGLSEDDTNIFMANYEKALETEFINATRRALKYEAAGMPELPSIRSCMNQRSGDDEWFCSAHKENGKLGISYSAFMSLPKLRPLVMKSDVDIPDDSEEAWLKQVPYDTRQGAVKELVGAYKSAFALKRGGHIKSFNMRYKSKKAVKQVFHCRSGALNSEEMKIFKSRLKKGHSKLRTRKHDLSKFIAKEDEGGHSDFTIQRMRPNAWYICLPRELKPEKRKPVFENAAYKACFIDPGVRSFGTFYSPEGVCGKYGEDFTNLHLQSISDKIDRLKPLASKSRFKTARNMRRRCQKLRNKLTNKVTDLHWKTCTFLTTAFQKIFIPKFGVTGMVGSPDVGVVALSIS
ncbi:hypothetical protein CEUSTIGMA_g10741.t1 [Chlamydomonas eustigma]|uniref:Uncharacterized protein n=1 Tax=Chlamydomonas eustigma TaxID=1157962 RepID=A0A250XJP8_9CHLO|nr:hypothetical protein CEUSTIGMA_g10741.t1 [Chlamydomonas eustigma]|eukprot:GAX83315.1 hypothetical protein CEUSTIGMA_g10741.t1 [Chlamydomonas eustigma]